MLAYLFWHRPLESVAPDAYEQAETAFQRSLARRPPVGLAGSACFRVHHTPWLEPRAGGARDRAYEDWYLIEDYAALGVLAEAAVGRGHRSAHDGVARRSGAGCGGLYGLVEGEASASLLGSIASAVWVSVAAGARKPALEDLLGDGMDPRRSALWRRQLVLGPAPEFCLLAPEVPAGVSPARLPSGWGAVTLERELLVAP
jgi:hypothetical protein